MDFNFPTSLNRLLVFVTLAECRSFRECGMRLKRTQPTVSRQIRELEEELRCSLFIRDPHRVELTDEGRELLSRVGEPVQQIARALAAQGQRLQHESVELRGKIRFGSLAEIGQSLLFGMVARFCKAHPGVTPELRYLEQREIREYLRRGELDFGIVTHAFDTESLRSNPLLTERIVLIGRPELKLPTGKNSVLPLIGYRTEDPLIELFERQFSRKGRLKPTPVAYVNSHRSMIEGLFQFDAFAYLPEFSARAELRSGRLKEISGFEHQQPLFLGYAYQAQENSVRRAFRAHLLKECRKVT